MSERQHMLPVWFFIGLLLSAYGIIIFITAIVRWSHPAAVVLSQYHFGVWAGIALILIGGFYVFHFRPRKRPRG